MSITIPDLYDSITKVPVKKASKIIMCREIIILILPVKKDALGCGQKDVPLPLKHLHGCGERQTGNTLLPARLKKASKIIINCVQKHTYYCP